MVRIKSPKTFRNRSRGLPTGAILYQKVEIFDILEPDSHPLHFAPIEVNFCIAMRTYVPVGGATFHVNRCDVSPLRGENADFLPVNASKFNSLTYLHK